MGRTGKCQGSGLQHPLIITQSENRRSDVNKTTQVAPVETDSQVPVTVLLMTADPSSWRIEAGIDRLGPSRRHS